MRLADLIENLPIELARGSAETRVEVLVEDSRAARSGALFVARTGTVTDGSRFVGDAVARGATAVLTDRSVRVDDDAATHLRCDDVAGCAARLAERFHGDPSTRLALVGVTGTNGKTTVASLVHQILAAAGTEAGLIGTVGVDLGGDDALPAALTTPPALETSALLHRMVERRCAACIMEVSSHALDQGRAAGLHFAGAVFTNLSGDHLDYHGTMDAYLDAKALLFERLPPDGWAVLNADDPRGAAVAGRSRGRVLTTSLRDAGADAYAECGRLRARGTETRLRGPWGVLDVRLPLVGRHNVANALQAALAAHTLGVDAVGLREGLARAAPPPGRLEPVHGPADDVTVLVDYAHTDDALVNVLAAVRPLVPAGGRLWVVFGCGGDRDRAKRPRMAAAACAGADEVLVTSDNPRTEDPAAIIDDVLAGVPAGRRAEVSARVDRAEAIGAAVAAARAGDVVVIAGKGHEDYQIVGRKKRPFDDRVVARAALAVRRGGGWTR